MLCCWRCAGICLIVEGLEKIIHEGLGVLWHSISSQAHDQSEGTRRERTGLKEVGQRLETIAPDVCFRVVGTDEGNDIVGEHLSVCIGAGRVSLAGAAAAAPSTYMVSSLGSIQRLNTSWSLSWSSISSVRTAWARPPKRHRSNKASRAPEIQHGGLLCLFIYFLAVLDQSQEAGQNDTSLRT